MTPVSTLLSTLSEQGISLVADGTELRFHPRDRMTPSLLAEVRAWKAELLVILASNVADTDKTSKTLGNCGGFVSGASPNTADQADPAGSELVPLRDHIPESAAEAGYWASISAADYHYLTGPRILPKSRCPWCGGYLVHSRACKDLTAAWEPTLPYGKYRGRRVRDVPVDYLMWRLGSAHSLSPDLRAVIERRVAGGRMEPSHAG